MRVKPNISREQLNTIGDRLRTIRDAHDLTQEGLAEVLGVQRETIGQWERGVTLPSASSLLTLSELYHVDVDYLLGRIDQKTHDLQFIHDKTGLSEQAIIELIIDKEIADRDPDNVHELQCALTPIFISKILTDKQKQLSFILSRVYQMQHRTQPAVPDFVYQLSPAAADYIDYDKSTVLYAASRFFDSVLSSMIDNAD